MDILSNYHDHCLSGAITFVKGLTVLKKANMMQPRDAREFNICNPKDCLHKTCWQGYLREDFLSTTYDSYPVFQQIVASLGRQNSSLSSRHFLFYNFVWKGNMAIGRLCKLHCSIR